MEVESERALIEATRKGDNRAFRSLVERYEVYVFNLAFRMMKNREEAEEVAQDAFIKVYRSLDQFRGDSKFVSWLYTIVYREAITRLRKKAPHTLELDETPVTEEWHSTEESGLDKLNRDERSAMIREALDQLRPAEAAVLTLFYLEEQSLRETSEITGMTEANVKVLLFRGRKNLLDAMRSSHQKALNEWL